MSADIRPRRDPAPIPAALASFAEKTLGAYRTVRFCGWDHAESSVWELETGAGEGAFLKAHLQARKYRQELRAYQDWLPHLPAVTPILLGVHDEPPHAILLSAVPGVLAEKLRLDPPAEREVYRQAGAFLRTMHDLPFEDRDQVSPGDALGMRLKAWLPRAGGLVPAGDIDWVVSRVQELLPLLEGQCRVPNHRDFTPRNWMVEMSGDEVRLHVIDFEHARPELRVLDFERLWCGEWVGREDLKHNFFEGYGRALTHEEWAVLERHAALGALTTIVWAREHDDAAFERRGREMLARLRNDKAHS